MPFRINFRVVVAVSGLHETAHFTVNIALYCRTGIFIYFT